MLREARKRLRIDGEEAGMAYLREMAARDPGLARALAAAVQEVPPEGAWPPALALMVKRLTTGS